MAQGVPSANTRSHDKKTIKREHSPEPTTLSLPAARKKRQGKESPYFKDEKRAGPRKIFTPRKDLSCIPFPPLSADHFGLVQERLSHKPFHLLLACIFLNKTRGAVAMPVFFDLISLYPEAKDIAKASQDEIVPYFQHLGLQNQRAKKVRALAQMWCSQPPERGKRYRRLHYPIKGDGRDIGKDECVDDDDERVGWEVAHLPGVGAYAFDSWRIFCRDELRGLRPTTNESEKEWTRVLPLDKELRAYLRWKWLKEGWIWSPATGYKRKARQAELNDAEKGGVIIEGDNGDEVRPCPIGKDLKLDI